MYDKKLKENIVNKLEKGEKVAVISGAFSISESTIYKWKKELKEEKENDYKEFSKLIENKNHEKALIIAKKYKDEKLCLELMKLYKKLKLTDQSILLANEFSNFNKIQLELSSIYKRKRKYEEAINIVENILLKNPNDTDALYKLIFLYVDARKFDKLKNIEFEYIDNEEVQYTIAYAFEKKHLFDEAVFVLNKYTQNKKMIHRIIKIYRDAKLYKRALFFCEKNMSDPYVIEQSKEIEKIMNKSSFLLENTNTFFNKDLLIMITNVELDYDNLLLELENESDMLKLIYRCAYIEFNKLSKKDMINLLENYEPNEESEYIILELLNSLKNNIEFNLNLYKDLIKITRVSEYQRVNKS